MSDQKSNPRIELEKEIREQGDVNTIRKFGKLLLLMIENNHIESENMTGPDDVMIKGEIRGYRKLLRVIAKKA